MVEQAHAVALTSSVQPRPGDLNIFQILHCQRCRHDQHHYSNHQLALSLVSIINMIRKQKQGCKHRSLEILQPDKNYHQRGDTMGHIDCVCYHAMHDQQPAHSFD